MLNGQYFEPSRFVPNSKRLLHNLWSTILSPAHVFSIKCMNWSADFQRVGQVIYEVGYQRMSERRFNHVPGKILGREGEKVI